MRASEGTDARPAPTRSTIVRVAVEVFASRGYDGASVREIAQLAGISKGNLTYHFAVKDDLLFEVVERLHDDFLKLARGWPEPVKRPRTALREACRDHVLLVCSQANATRVSYEAFRYLSAPRRAAIVHKRDVYEAELRRLVMIARPGDSAQAIVDTRIVLGMLNWAYQWFDENGEVSAESMAEEVASMALRALRV
jgi:AcrR family transcriptional regulator